MSEKISRKDCEGCNNDVYNRSDFGMNKRPDGSFRCWSAKDATLVEAYDVHINQPPPYLHLPLVERPSCFKERQMVRVKPSALDSKGFWKG